MRHNWRGSLQKFRRLKVLLMQFFPVALSVIFCLCMRSATSALVEKWFELEILETNDLFKRVFPFLIL